MGEGRAVELAVREYGNVEEAGKGCLEAEEGGRVLGVDF